jgi:hypothetical protein
MRSIVLGKIRTLCLLTSCVSYTKYISLTLQYFRYFDNIGVKLESQCLVSACALPGNGIPVLYLYVVFHICTKKTSLKRRVEVCVHLRQVRTRVSIKRKSNEMIKFIGFPVFSKASQL